MNRTVAALALLLLAAGCRGGSAVPPPMPTLDGVEPQVAERIREADRAVRAEPGSPEAWGRLGEVYDVHDLVGPALTCYGRAEALDPAEWRWPYLRGVLLRASDQTAAIGELERAASLGPGYAPLQFYLGHGYAVLERPDDAETAYRRALELDPGHVNARLGLAEIEMLRGDAEAALALLEQAVRIAPDEAAVHRRLAQALRAAGHEERARREERLAATSPTPAELLGFASLPDPVRAEAIARSGVSTRLLLERARALLGRGQSSEAARVLERLLALHPDSVGGLLEYGRLLGGVGRFDEALARVGRATEIDPQSAAARAEMGNLRVAMGDAPAAIEAYRASLRLDPAQPETTNNLAALLIQTGRVEEGLELLRGVQRSLPDSSDAAYNLAAALLLTGDLPGARAILLELLGRQPDFADARYLLGTIHARQARYDEAAAEWTRVVEEQPDHLDARLDLGRLLWQQKRYAEAVDAFRAAAERAPDDVDAARELAWALAVCPDGRTRDGAEALRRARALCERTGFGNPLLLDVLAAAQAETGDFGGAGTSAERALRIVESVLSGQGGPAVGPADRSRLQALAGRLRDRLSSYRDGKRWRER